MIVFTDRCLDQISKGIAAHEPEVGGALLKLQDSNIVCEFVADPTAQNSRFSYVPSAELTENIRIVERDQNLQFAGVIHSHPGGMSQPSGQDHRAFALSLALNPRVGGFIAPIVTVAQPVGSLRPNQHLLEPRGIMTLHIAYRAQRGHDLQPYQALSVSTSERPTQEFLATDIASIGRSWRNVLLPHARADRAAESKGTQTEDPRDDRIELFEAPIGVLSIDADVELLKRYLIQSCAIEWRGCNVSYVNINGAPFISAAIRFTEIELVLLMSAGYPFSAPVALLTPMSRGETGVTAQVQFDWPIGAQHERLTRLAEAAAEKWRRGA